MLNSYAVAPYYFLALLAVSISSPMSVKSAFISRPSLPVRSVMITNNNRINSSNVATPIRAGVGVALSAEEQEVQQQQKKPQQPDQYSEAFTAYMTKSHEEKLKAVKVAEDNKNAEIKALKQQLEDMTNGIVPTTTDSSLSQSLEQISSKLTAYQNFMSEYIVKAQEDKYKAVRAAEEALSKKYEGRLDALLLNPVDANAITVPAHDTNKEQTIDTYEKRSKEVKAAGEAGKSRWGVEEVQRMSSSNK